MLKESQKKAVGKVCSYFSHSLLHLLWYIYVYIKHINYKDIYKLIKDQIREMKSEKQMKLKIKRCNC